MTTPDAPSTADPPGSDTLAEWTAALAEALDVPTMVINTDAVLALAGTIAHAVVRPAAPVSTYVVGFAAGRAAASGDVEAFERLAALAEQLAENRERGHASS